jgi:hypothetical protein
MPDRDFYLHEIEIITHYVSPIFLYSIIQQPKNNLDVLSGEEAVEDLVAGCAGGGLPGLEQLEVVVAGQDVEELGVGPGHGCHPVLVACTQPTVVMHLNTLLHSHAHIATNTR